MPIAVFLRRQLEASSQVGTSEKIAFALPTSLKSGAIQAVRYFASS